MIVKENISFERGLNPKKALGVGKYRPIYNPTAEDLFNLPEGIYLLEREPYGRPSYCYIECVPSQKIIYVGFNWVSTKEDAKKEWRFYERFPYTIDIGKEAIDDWEILSCRAVDDKLLENVSFQRGLDTKAALNVGQRKIIEKWFEDVQAQLSANIIDYTINDDLSVYVNGSLYLLYTMVDKLPDNLTVEGDLHLTGTRITKLPDNLTVNGHLILSKTKITELPNNLTVGENLYLKAVDITNIPPDLKVSGRIITK